MKTEELIWTKTAVEEVLHTPVYDVLRQSEAAGTGQTGDFYALTTVDWVVIVPVWRDSFVLVKQWRHGEDNLTTEFPGGVMEPGEEPAQTAARELLEETGFRAGKLTCMGRVSPNPALFKNHFYCFLAEDLVPTGEQHLDEDELLNYELHPVAEVLESFGSPEYSHAFMGTALAFYMRRLGYVPGAGPAGKEA